MELKVKVEVDPPTDLEEPSWCGNVRELLSNDQAPKALKLADRAVREAVKRKDHRCISRSLPSRLQDKSGEGRARQMQVFVLLELPGEDPADTAEVAKQAVEALKASGDQHAELWTLRVQALLEAEAMLLDEANDTANRRVQMLARAREMSSEPSAEALALLTSAEIARLSGARAKGQGAAEDAMSLFLRAGDRAGQGAVHQVLSDLARLEGDSDDALQAAPDRRALALVDLAEEVEALRVAEKACKICLSQKKLDWESQAVTVLAQAKLAVCDSKSDGDDINHSILKIAKMAAERITRFRPFHRTLLAQALSIYSDALLRTAAYHSALKTAKDAKRLYSKAGLEAWTAPPKGTKMEAEPKAQLKLAEAEVGLGRAEQAKEDLEEAFNVFKASEYFDGQDRVLDLMDVANKTLGLPTRAEIAEQKRKEKEKQQQLRAMRYWHQQQLRGQGMPAQLPPQMMVQPGEEVAQTRKAEKVELQREASPLDLKAGMDLATIKSKVTQVASVIMGGDEDFEADTPLMEARLTSNTAMVLRDELTKDLPGIKLPMTLSFDYPSVQAIADFGSSHVDTSPASSRNSLWAAEAGRVRRRSSIVVRPAMQLLRLMPILMMSLLWQAWSQEDDDVDDVDDVEFEELEDGPENDGTFEPEDCEHPPKAGGFAFEAVEGEHGLYDNAEAGHEGIMMRGGAPPVRETRRRHIQVAQLLPSSEGAVGLPMRVAELGEELATARQKAVQEAQALEQAEATGVAETETLTVSTTKPGRYRQHVTEQERLDGEDKADDLQEEESQLSLLQEELQQQCAALRPHLAAAERRAELAEQRMAKGLRDVSSAQQRLLVAKQAALQLQQHPKDLVAPVPLLLDNKAQEMEERALEEELLSLKKVEEETLQRFEANRPSERFQRSKARAVNDGVQQSGPYDADVKAAINAPLNEDGRSLLQAVAAKGLLRPLGYLLDMAANCARKDRLGLTALHEAAQNGQNEAAQLLLTRGRAPSNARDAAGQTPLQLAMEKGSNSTVQTLMRFGANVKLLDASKVPEEAQKLMEWTRRDWFDGAAQVQLRRKDVKSLGNEVPHHIVAPKLVLTPIGYCPVNDDGEVYQLKRGVRFAKRRQGPSAPRGKAKLSELHADAAQSRRLRADLLARLAALKTHQEMQSRLLETQRLEVQASEEAVLRSSHEALQAEDQELQMDSKLRSAKGEVQTLEAYLQRSSSERQQLLNEVSLGRQEEAALEQEEQARQNAQLRLSRELESARAG
eukprot:g9459.t1